MAENILEALRIFSQSWPLAFLFIALFGGVALYAVVRAINRASIQRARIDAEKTLDLERAKAVIGSIDGGRGLPKPRSRRDNEDDYNG